MNDAEIVAGACVARVDGYGPLKMCDGVVVQSLVTVQDAHVIRPKP